MIRILQNNKVNKDKIADYLFIINDYFEPSLEKRLFTKSDVQSFHDYAIKILKHASCVGVLESNNLKGLLVIYHNDENTKRAYIPILAILPSFSGKGLASALINEAILLAKSSQIKHIFVNTWINNKKAIQLYKKNGFEIHDIEKNDVKLKYTILE
jgi:ribosomal protein S18 acetylase RimI-like enzyme